MNKTSKLGIALLIGMLVALPLTGTPVADTLAWARTCSPWALLTNSQTALSSAISDMKSKYCLSLAGVGFEPTIIGL